MAPSKQGGSKKGSGPAQEYQETAADVLEEAEWAFMREEFDNARKLYKQACEMDPENAKCWDHLGMFLSETGDVPAAIEALRKAVTLSPAEGFEKYMYLAQVLEGDEAQDAARKGIHVCRMQLRSMKEEAAAAATSEQQQGKAEAGAGKDGGDEDEEDDAMELEMDIEMLQEQLSSCLCTLAELLLNDAEPPGPAAEGVPAVGEALAQEVEGLLQEASELAPRSPEPLQILASLRKEQEREEEALRLLRQSMALWFRPPKEEGSEEEAASEDLGEKDSEEMDEDEPELPSYEFRFETAKLLLELDEDTEAATQVLEQLLDENDQVPYVYMLLAVCYQGAGELDAALEAAEDGQRCAKAAGLPEDHEVTVGLAELAQELRQLSEEEAAREAGAGHS